MTGKHPQDSRFGGALTWAAVASLPGLAFVVLCVWRNPWFVDAPFSLWFWVCGLPAVAGGFGGLLRPMRRRVVWWVVLALGGMAVYGLSFRLADGRVSSLDVLVLGVDGVSWDEFQPMIDRGELPNFARLKEQGATGTMTAPEPLFSPLIWTTLATGWPPSEHGIRGLKVKSTDCKRPRFWDIAAHEGRSVGLFKWLVTWPPQPRQGSGFTVPGWLAQGTETEPPSLGFVKEIELSNRLSRRSVEARRGSLALTWEAIGGGWRWTTLRDAVLWTLRARVVRPDPSVRFQVLQGLRTRMDRDVFLATIRRQSPDVAAFVVYETDAVSHRYWRYHEPDAFEGVEAAELARHGEVVRNAYRRADRVLGELWSVLPEEGRLVVLSDHGFKAVEMEGGALLAPSTKGLTQRIQADLDLRVNVIRVGNKAVVTLFESDMDTARDALTQWAASIQLHDGRQVFRVEAVPSDAGALALALESRRATLSHEAASLRALVTELDDQFGDHQPQGLFAAVGPGVIGGAVVDVDAVDVMPILLSGMEIAVGADMPGRLPQGLWPASGEVPSWNHLVVPTERANEPESPMDIELLRQLGYIDG